jgi:hypothetical protein
LQCKQSKVLQAIQLSGFPIEKTAVSASSSYSAGGSTDTSKISSSSKRLKSFITPSALDFTGDDTETDVFGTNETSSSSSLTSTNVGSEKSGIGFIPVIYSDILTKVSKIKPDGHCGFRSISLQIFDNEDNFQRVRAEMLNCLESERKDTFSKLLGYASFGRVRKQLSYIPRPNELIYPKSSWFSMDTMGHLAATAFKRPLIALERTAIHANNSFFPLIPVGECNFECPIILVASNNRDHYDLGCMESQLLVYPRPPASWYEYIEYEFSEEQRDQWKRIVQSKIESYLSRFPLAEENEVDVS